jgi:hypothetical protein
MSTPYSFSRSFCAQTQPQHKRPRHRNGAAIIQSKTFCKMFGIGAATCLSNTAIEHMRAAMRKLFIGARIPSPEFDTLCAHIYPGPPSEDDESVFCWATLISGKGASLITTVCWCCNLGSVTFWPCLFLSSTTKLGFYMVAFSLWIVVFSTRSIDYNLFRLVVLLRVF